MAEPALIERIEAGARRPPAPMEPQALEPPAAEEVPAEAPPDQRTAQPPPAPESLGAGRVAAARTSSVMQARFGNARTARLMSESPLGEGRATAAALTPAATGLATAAAPAAELGGAATPVAESLTTAPGVPAAEEAPAAPAVAAEAAPAPEAAAAPEAVPTAQAEPAAPELEAPPGAPAPGAGPPPAAPTAAAAAAPPTPEAAAAAGAAPAPPPALDTSSTEGMIASLGSFPPSALGPALAQASTELPGLQAKEKTELAQSLPEIDRPTGLPPRPAPPEAESTDLAVPAPVEGETPEARQGEPPPLGGEVASGPVPGEDVSTIAPEPPVEEEDGGDSWWSSIWGRIKSFLKSLPSTDSGVSTSAGPRPRVDMSGEANPSENRKQQGKSDTQVQDARAKADAATHADFGENDIAPVVPPGERLRPGYQPGAPSGAAPAGRQTPPVDPEVQAAFDQQAAPKMAETVAEQRSQEAVDREEYRQKSSEVRAEGERRIQEETEKSRTEQEGLRQSARADVQAERERWRGEDEKAGKDYSEKSEAQRRETDKQVDEKAKAAEKQADEKLTQAERDAETKKRETEAQAAAKKREAESRPRSWWDRVKGAVSAAFSALKRAVTGLFNVLRAAVKKLINAVKSVVRGLIEAARMAIVGLIKAYGLALKGLVSIALFAFPETARKARAFIDDRVNDTVNAVNSAADALKNACDRALDWVAEGLDFALGLLQKAVLFYIELYEKLVMLLLDVLERIGNLVSSAKQMPDHFFGQMSEELLGMNLTEPLPIERSAPPDASKTAKAALEAGEIEPGDLRAVTQRGVGADQIQLDGPPLVEELHPDLLKQFGATEGREIEFGERDGPEFGLPALQHAAMGAPPAAAGPAATNQPAASGGGGAETQAERAERELQELMARPMPDTCGAETKQEPAGPSQVPEEMKIGPLSAGQRGRYLLDQMVKGIKKWFACNWPKLLAGAVAAILGVILLNVLTGGAILAALPLLMKVVALVMLGAAVVRVTSYVGDYLSMAWDGNLVGGAKALARGLAIGAVELVFALLFNLGAVIKALKGGLKGAAKVAAKAAKETVVGGLKAARDLGKLGIQAAKTAVKNGKLILSGLRAGAVRGARSIKDFTVRLWKNLRFRKFKIVFSRGWFRLLGWINPWIVVMEGEMKGQLKKIDKSELQGRKVLRDVDASKFKTVENETVMGKLISESDDLPTNYRHNAEIFFGKSIDDSVVHHMIEQQTRNLTTAVNDILLHAPANLKLIPKGQINSVVHLSRIRVMWNQLYKGIKAAGVPDKAVLASLRHFERYTDEFIEHMLSFAKKEGSALTKASLQKEADDWLKLLMTKVKEAEEIGKQALNAPAAAGGKVVK